MDAVYCVYFLTVPWVGLQFVIEAFPGYTHFFFDDMSKVASITVRATSI